MQIPLFVGYEASVRPGRRTWARGSRVEIDGADLVRHAFICGSTGSGKTVFAKGIVEEALIQGIPVIALDVKGDLASLALPGATASTEQTRRVLADDHPSCLGEFETGIAEFPAVRDRVGLYVDQAAPRIFTPRSAVGVRLAMASLPRFDLEGATGTTVDDYRNLNEVFARSLAARLYSPRAIAALRHEPEVRLIEGLNWWAMENGESFDGVEGIQRLSMLASEPPLAAVGGMPIDEFLPPADRQKLRRKLAASVGGAGRTWYEGEPVDVETLLARPSDGRTPLSIVYLGHLDTFEEQAFVIARVCTAIFQWMRRLGGSSRPRLLLYLDEVGGGDGRTAFYPPAPFNPVSKAPLALLVKQGRSSGVGVVLATQNPVSVDLRALANVHTWAVGRLNQRNDQQRVSDSLGEVHEGARRLKQILPSLPQHHFLLKSEADAVQEPGPVLERWLYTIHKQLGRDQVERLSTLLEGGGWPRRSPGAGGASQRRPSPSPTPPAEGRAGMDMGGAETRAMPTETLPLGGPPPGPSEPRGRWSLVLPTGERIELSSGLGVVIGRSRRADVQINDRYASGRHVEVQAQGETVRIRDLSARNPARVGGAALDGEMELHADSAPLEITIGETSIQLVNDG